MVEIAKTTVIGAGVMGHGIAQVFAQAGCEVALYDVDEKVLQKVKDQIRANLLFQVNQNMIKRETIPFVLTRIDIQPDFNVAVSESELILEAVPERLDLKQEVLSKAEENCPSDTILATTTSVIRVGDIATSLKRPQLLVGTHWMNPPFVLPLVEVIRGPKTSEETLEQVRQFLEKKCQKRTVTCNDTPGFLVNRMAAAVLTEAAKLIDEGIATHVEIDQAWKEHLGLIFLLYGPFGNLDHIGLDVLVLAAKYLAWALNDDKYTLPKWLEEKFLQGDLGVKTGKGVYEYPNQTPQELRQKRAENLLLLLRKIGLVSED